MTNALTTVARRWTIADLDDIPDDGNRYELIDGELHVTTAPHFWHQIVQGNLQFALDTWSKQSGAGLTVPGPGVIFSPADAVIPDLVWVSRGRLAEILGDDGKLYAAPELAVEILSPGPANEKHDRVTKRSLYSDWGVQEYWIVDRFTRTVEVLRLAGGALQMVATLAESDALESPMLPGFSCRVAELFAEIPT
jgi:Uma2 family endonuclease